MFAIKIQFSGKLRLELYRLEFNNHKTVQAGIVEQKVNKIVVDTYFELVLSPDV